VQSGGELRPTTIGVLDDSAAGGTGPEGGRKYKVDDKITAKLRYGRKVDATVRAVFQQDGETKLNIDYGHEETATIGLSQVL
jgi:hypothetical protein